VLSEQLCGTALAPFEAEDRSAAAAAAVQGAARRERRAAEGRDYRGDGLDPAPSP
jgi:hypothetical protein